MKEIYLGSAKKPVLVDDIDEQIVTSRAWRVGSHGYARLNVKVNGKQTTVLLHRLLMGLMPGDRRQVDHINGDILDNRRSNLRICTVSQNQANRGKQSNNSTGLKGVELGYRGERWIARIGYKGKSIHLGSFDTPELAKEFHMLASEMLFGEFAKN